MATFVNDFVMNFHVFVDLSLVVCSIAIRNIKPDGLAVKTMNFGVDSLIEKSMIWSLSIMKGKVAMWGSNNRIIEYE